MNTTKKMLAALAVAGAALGAMAAEAEKDKAIDFDIRITNHAGAPAERRLQSRVTAATIKTVTDMSFGTYQFALGDYVVETGVKVMLQPYLAQDGRINTRIQFNAKEFTSKLEGNSSKDMWPQTRDVTGAEMKLLEQGRPTTMEVEHYTIEVTARVQ